MVRDRIAPKSISETHTFYVGPYATPPGATHLQQPLANSKVRCRQTAMATQALYTQDAPGQHLHNEPVTARHSQWSLAPCQKLA